jgi:predicted transcriptional regulator
VAEEQRLERLLALLLLQQMKTAPQREKAVQLSIAGFSNVEIADLLQTTGAVVRQYLYEARRSKATRKPSRRKKT